MDANPTKKSRAQLLCELIVNSPTRVIHRNVLIKVYYKFGSRLNELQKRHGVEYTYEDPYYTFTSASVSNAQIYLDFIHEPKKKKQKPTPLRRFVQSVFNLFK